MVDLETGRATSWRVLFTQVNVVGGFFTKESSPFTVPKTTDALFSSVDLANPHIFAISDGFLLFFITHGFRKYILEIP